MATIKNIVAVKNIDHGEAVVTYVVAQDATTNFWGVFGFVEDQDNDDGYVVGNLKGGTSALQEFGRNWRFDIW
jgi:hypothetical protein